MRVPRSHAVRKRGKRLLGWTHGQDLGRHRSIAAAAPSLVVKLLYQVPQGGAVSRDVSRPSSVIIYARELSNRSSGEGLQARIRETAQPTALAAPSGEDPRRTQP